MKEDEVQNQIAHLQEMTNRIKKSLEKIVESEEKLFDAYTEHRQDLEEIRERLSYIEQQIDIRSRYT